MKIGIITYTFNIGGVSTFILSLGKYFKEQGHSIEIITEEDKGIWFDEINKEGFAADSISSKYFSWLPFGLPIHSYRVGKLIKNKKFDVVLLNNCLYAQLAAHLYNKNSVVISIVHNNNKGIFQVAARNTSNISAIACVSFAAFNGIKKITDFNNVYCIPNGIPLPQRKPCFPKVKDNNTLSIISVGHLANEQKGIFFFPYILKKCKEKNYSNIHLTIVGNGNDKNELVRLLKENNVYEMVTFRGHLPRLEVYDLYLSHHIFLMTSLYEGLPLTLLEAMACGCVPVVSYLKDITDFCIEDHKDGFLCQIGDTDAFADRITYLASNPSMIDEMGSRCAQKIVSSFSIQKMGEEYLNLIHQLKDAKICYSGFRMHNFSWKDIFPRKLILSVKKIINKIK